MSGSTRCSAIPSGRLRCGVKPDGQGAARGAPICGHILMGVAVLRLPATRCTAEPRTLQLRREEPIPVWPMHILKRLFGRVDGPLLHGMLAGSAIMVISSLGLFYLWHSVREAQLDAVQTELVQLARVAATLVDGDRHRLLKSQAQAGSADHLALLAPLVKFHKATSDIIYVYTAILHENRIYYVAGTDY